MPCRNVLYLLVHRHCVHSYEAHVKDPVEQHESIQEAKSAIQQPSYCTLEDCFQLYTREERVCTPVNMGCVKCKLALHGLAAYLLNVLQQCTVHKADVNKDGGC